MKLACNLGRHKIAEVFKLEYEAFKHGLKFKPRFKESLGTWLVETRIRTSNPGLKTSNPCLKTSNPGLKLFKLGFEVQILL